MKTKVVRNHDAVTRQVDTNVYDRWWPWRIGTIVKVLKTRLHVQWADGETWVYDRPHEQFLRDLDR